MVTLAIRSALTDQNAPASLLLLDPLSPPCEEEGSYEHLKPLRLSLTEGQSEHYIKSSISKETRYPAHHKNDTPTLFVSIDDSGTLYIMIVEISSDGSIHTRQLPITFQYMIEDIDELLDDLAHLHNVIIVQMGQVLTITAINKQFSWTIEKKENATQEAEEEEDELLQPLKQRCPIGSTGMTRAILTPGKGIQCMTAESQPASPKSSSDPAADDESELEEGEIRTPPATPSETKAPNNKSTSPLKASEIPCDPELPPDDQTATNAKDNNHNPESSLIVDLRTRLNGRAQLQRAEEILNTQLNRVEHDARAKIELKRHIQFIRNLLIADSQLHRGMINHEIQKMTDSRIHNTNIPPFWHYTVAILEQCGLLDSAQYFMESMRLVIPKNPDLAKALIWHFLHRKMRAEANETLENWERFAQYNDWVISELRDMTSDQNVQKIEKKGFTFFDFASKNRKRHKITKSDKGKKPKYEAKESTSDSTK